MPLIQAVLVDPRCETTSVTVDPPWDEALNAMKFTRLAARAMSQEERDTLIQVVPRLQAGVQRIFGVHLATEVLVVDTVEELVVGIAGSSTILHAAPSPDTDSNRYVVDLCHRLAQSWWGAGMRTTGRHSYVIGLGVRTFAAGLIQNALLGGAADIGRARARHQPKQAAVKTAMGIAWPLLAALRDDNARRDSFRAFIQAASGKSIPDRQFIEWCRTNGISIPAELEES